MRIHLLCDQKWRDLPNLTALKIALEALGHGVLLSTTKDANAMLQAFRPHCVVLNHLFSPSNQKLAAALKRNGVAVVILPTEGAVRPELRSLAAGEFANDWQMDLHMAWSEEAAHDIRSRWGLDESAVPAVGCTRFDFYTAKFRDAVTSRQDFCARNGLDPCRPIITWATAYNFADLVEESPRRSKFLREVYDNGVAESYRRIGVEPERIPQIHANGRSKSVSAFAALARARPHLQFILRPHPAESRSHYQKLIQENELRSVHFCPQDYIWNVLRASDLHLHRHCTTAVEAWMWDKPTIEMGMDSVPQIRWPERERGSDVADTADELVDTVDARLANGETDQSRREYRSKYIHRWFGPADGRRCIEAARTIDTLLRTRRARMSPFLPLRNIRATPRQVGAAVLRYALNLRPAQPLFRRTEPEAIDPQDKLITRGDVRKYSRRIATALR